MNHIILEDEGPIVRNFKGTGKANALSPSIVSVKNCRYFGGKEAYKIFINGIYNDDAREVARYFTKMALSDKDVKDTFFITTNLNSEGLYIFVPVDKFDLFMNCDNSGNLNTDSYCYKIFNFISNTFKSNFKNKKTNEIKEFTRYKGINECIRKIKSFKINAVTQEDVKNAQDMVRTNMKEILSSLNNPDFKNGLLKFEMSDDFARKYGWKLSYRNSLYVLAQKRDATFVASAYMWEVKFGRQVKKGAQRIIIETPAKDTGNLTLNDYKNAKIKSGYDPDEDVNEVQPNHAINTTAQEDLDAKFIYPKAVFDVSETELLPGVTFDKWSKEMGLKNRLTGELNDAAKIDNEKYEKERTQKRIDREDNMSPQEKSQQENLLIAKSNLLNYCAKKKIEVKENGNLVTDVSNLVYAIAYKETTNSNRLLRKQDISRNPNKFKDTKEFFAENVTFMIMSNFGFNYQNKNSGFDYANQEWDNEDIDLYFRVYFLIASIINKKSEDIETVKESYNSFLNRLNNVIL